MTSFPAAGLYGIRNVGRFAGRDSRSQFWFWVLWLFIGQQALTGLAAVALFSLHVGGDVTTMSPAEGRWLFRSFATVIALGTVIPILLVVAAVARRLHDGDLSGAWGLLPVPFLAFGTGAMLLLFGSAEAPSMSLFAALFVNNLIYLAALVALVVLLCRASTPGPNRFGPPPAN